MTRRAHGQLRQSQVVTTFGPGSMLDLPNYSVLVGGLDFWSPNGRVEIFEPRLVDKLRTILQVPSLRLFSPPPEPDDPLAPQTGIGVWQFPEWFISQDVEVSRSDPGLRSRLLVHRKALSRGAKFEDDNRVSHTVVPVRFVRACPRGHIGDLEWRSFVHSGASPCVRQLWLDERGTSGDLSEVFVRCECGARRSMADAIVVGSTALGSCNGDRPWLGLWTREACGVPSRLLLRTATNAYFSQLMSVISLPDRNDDVAKAVSAVWEDFLQYVDAMGELAKERRKERVRVALEGFSDDEVWGEIAARKAGVTTTSSDRSVKEVELQSLATSREEIGEDVPDGDFFARALPSTAWDAPWMSQVERVVLVHRLREVIAQVGFTRFEAVSADTEGELSLDVQRAALAREADWLPAVENRGEGLFLQLRRSDVDAWLKRPEVLERGRQLAAAFEAWRADHPGSKRVFPGLPYILLHSLSHLLLTSLSLECGYPASSLRERVYAGEGGCGILIFTASPDAEGTLGGLVEAGRQIRRHLRAALELGRLCSHDPVCAQHDASDRNERRFLQGAACHGCLLVAETSCEQHNDFLDRALVVPTVASLGAELFTVGTP